MKNNDYKIDLDHCNIPYTTAEARELIYETKSKKINPKLIKSELGCGAEGIVFAYDTDKVIKFFNSFDGGAKPSEYNEVMKKLVRKKSNHYCKIFMYGNIFYNCKYECIQYYIAERLSTKLNRIHTPYWNGIINLLNKKGLPKYGDLHDDNVMLSCYGKQKICDLNGFLYE